MERAKMAEESLETAAERGGWLGSYSEEKGSSESIPVFSVLEEVSSHLPSPESPVREDDPVQV